MPSNLTRNYEDDPKRVFHNNSFDDSNLLLAASLHDSMVRFVGRKDRGIRRARFMTVLQGQQRPAALLEGGFLTDTAEARLIASNDYRQKLAQSIAFALRLTSVAFLSPVVPALLDPTWLNVSWAAVPR